LDLERLQRRRSEEIFHVRSPGSAAPVTIHVCGDSGVAWSCGGSENRQHFCDFPDIADISIKQAASRDGGGGGAVENRLVTVTKADNRVLEVEFASLREARSFVALLDGYYRLTADAQHYFCREVAPPRLLEDLENQCHGPISAEFAVNKLEAAGGAPGLFLLRRSPQDFDSYLLTVCVQVRPPGHRAGASGGVTTRAQGGQHGPGTRGAVTRARCHPWCPFGAGGVLGVPPVLTPVLPPQTRSGRDYKRCRIRRDEDGHWWLSGVARRFCSLRELLGTYGHRGLQAEGAPMRLEVACPPRAKEKSNLLIVRSGVPCPPGSPPAPRRRSLQQMMFHKIDPQSLTRGESLGQGSFTQIYRGIKREQDEQDGARQTPVVLKVMDGSHRNCLEVRGRRCHLREATRGSLRPALSPVSLSQSFLEAASTMSQLSHKHLVLLHGVSLGKDSVMVQEHVRHGPLDLYLRKNRGVVTTGWKLTVAKQLAYALNYL
ncbi:JAK3 kinase, partial [Passerina amoena]|nr:JAK3 kinase [Passerina amoena]